MEKIQIDNFETLDSLLRRIGEEYISSWSRLAEDTGLTRQGLFQILKRPTDPKISSLIKIFKQLGINFYVELPVNDS